MLVFSLLRKLFNYIYSFTSFYTLYDALRVWIASKSADAASGANVTVDVEDPKLYYGKMC